MNLRIRRRSEEEGSIIIIIMMMILVFMALGMALFYLVRSASTGTELERKELRSFNVAEAGVDAGMLALKTSWPRNPGIGTSVNRTALRNQFPEFRKPTILEEFIDVWIYDNSTVGSTDATYQAHPTWFTQLEDGTIHPNWDMSTDDPRLTEDQPDDRMVVDSRSNVDNDRKRILIQAQQAIWPLRLPFIAMQAETATVENSSPHGFWVSTDSGQESYLPTTAIFDPDTSKVLIKEEDQLKILTNDVANYPFSAYAGTIDALRSIARLRGTLFEGVTAAETVTAADLFLEDTDKTPGAVVFVDLTKFAGTVVMAGGNTGDIGTPSNPTVLVLQGNKDLVIDWKGSGSIWGVVIVDGSALNRGKATFHGSILSSGMLEGKGAAAPDVYYNGKIIELINGANTINVSIVPNTWVERQP